MFKKLVDNYHPIFDVALSRLALIAIFFKKKGQEHTEREHRELNTSSS